MTTTLPKPPASAPPRRPWQSLALALALTWGGITGPLQAPTLAQDGDYGSGDPALQNMDGFTPDLVSKIEMIEQNWQHDYEKYLQLPPGQPATRARDVIAALSNADLAAQTRTAFLWIAANENHLALTLLTGEGEAIHRLVPIPRDRVMQVIRLWIGGITDPLSPPNRYLPPSQQLYQWMIAPLEPTLKAENIDTLIFCMGQGLRSLPLGALHDGQGFLVERYSLARVPAFSLADLAYNPLTNSQVLAMGASEFSDQPPLPAVPLEMDIITQELWPGEAFLNEEFTLDNLRHQRQQQPYGIIHLATHADFQPGDPANSYIQLWDSRLGLDHLDELNWDDPMVDLLVLSACKTAIGDISAELGFAGLALQAGVKSALASLWSVSDVGTLVLMTEFYNQLDQVTSKAEALRQAQLALLHGTAKIDKAQDQAMELSLRGRSLPEGIILENPENFSHPFYWSAFTLVGSPW
jgi:CHAT domain-containing protein